jgi:hypothetical protein
MLIMSRRRGTRHDRGCHPKPDHVLRGQLTNQRQADTVWQPCAPNTWRCDEAGLRGDVRTAPEAARQLQADAVVFMSATLSKPQGMNKAIKWCDPKSLQGREACGEMSAHGVLGTPSMLERIAARE